MLFAKDRGCTKTGCTAPGYFCQVHHIEEWAAYNGPTDIDSLTLACGSDNRSVRPGGWQTRKRKDGRTEWIPPPQNGQPSGVNDFHHPENYLTDE